MPAWCDALRMTFRCRSMASVSHQGRTSAAAVPFFGQIAPKM
jgi:hypothetical protein